jgi:hypothetical protein
VRFSSDDPCVRCEEMLQPFLDRELTTLERNEYCRRRYRFEVHLRRFVRQSVAEPMAPELKQRLLSLRTPL